MDSKFVFINMLQPLIPQKSNISVRIFKKGVRNRIRFDRWEESYYASRLEAESSVRNDLTINKPIKRSPN
jgi:hypothetical protein